MAANVKVGIQISAIDNTRRALASVRRNFAQMQRQFASVNRLGSVGDMGSQFRKVRREVMATAGVSRRFISGTGTGAELIATRALPKLEKSLKKTGKTSEQVTRKFADNWNSIGGVFSNAYITAFIFFRAIQAGAGYMAQATIDNEKYIKTLQVIEGSAADAHARMKEMHDLARAPALRAPEAAQSFIRLRSTGLSSPFSKQVITEFANAMAIAGGTSRDLSESIRQLGQMISTGKVDMENFRVILERMPTIREAFQRSYGPAAVHTEVLQGIMKKENIQAEDLWRRVFDEMQFLDRAATDTLENKIESFQDAFWELSANLGDLWAPDFKSVLDQLTKVIDGFNNLSDPVREFIGWMGSAVGIFSTFGVTLFALSKMFKVAKEPFGRFFNFFRTFHEKPVFGKGAEGLLGRRYSEKYGSAPTIVRGDLMHEHRKRKSLFASKETRAKGPLKEEMEEYAKQKDKDLADAKQQLQNSKNNFRSAYAENERLAREALNDELLNSTKMAQQETRKAEATEIYNQKLEDVATRIQSEQTKMARHKQTLTKAELELTERYQRHFVERQKYAKKIDHWMTTGEELEKGTVDRFLWHSENMDKLRNQIKSPLGAAGEIYKLQKNLTDARINQTRVYAETGNKLFKQKAKPVLKQYKKDLIETLIKEDVAAERAELDKGERLTETDYKRITDAATEQVKKMGLTVEDLPKEYVDTVRQNVKPELDAAMKEINEVVKQTQADLDSALEKGNMGKLKALHHELDNLIQGYDEAVRVHLDETAELDDKIAEDNRRRASFFDETGKRIFHDPENEKKILQGQEKFVSAWRSNQRQLSKNVKETDTLRKRAWANFKSIDHLDNLVEMAYGAGIGLAIAGITTAVTALVVHFDRVKTSTQEFTDLLKKELPTVKEWQKQYVEWADVTYELATGIELVGPAQARLLAKEKERLDTLKGQNKIYDFQLERLKKINRILEFRGRHLDDEGGYLREFKEDVSRKTITELANQHTQAQNIKEMEKSIESLRKQLKEVDPLTYFSKGLQKVDIQKFFSEKELKRLSDVYRTHMDLRGELVRKETWWKLHESVPEIFGLYTKRTRLDLDLDKLIEKTILEKFDAMPREDRPKIDTRFFATKRDTKENIKDFLEIYWVLKKLEYEYKRLLKEMDAVNAAFEKGKEALREFNIAFKDLDKISIPISNARKELEKLNATFFHFDMPMQSLLGEKRSYYQDVTKLEDTRKDELEKARKAAQDQFDILQAQRKIQEDREDLLKIIAKAGDAGKKYRLIDIYGELSEEALRSDEDFRRLAAIYGTDTIYAILNKVNELTLYNAEVKFIELKKKWLDVLVNFEKDMKKTEEDFLDSLRVDYQSKLVNATLFPATRVREANRYIDVLQRGADVIDDLADKEEIGRILFATKQQINESEAVQREWDERRRTIIDQMSKLGKVGHFLGFSERRIQEFGGRFKETIDREVEANTAIFRTFLQVIGENPIFDENKLKASASVMAAIRKTTKFIADNSGMWRRHLTYIDIMVKGIRSNLYDLPVGIRDVRKDEVQFLESWKEALLKDSEGDIGTLVSGIRRTISDAEKASSKIRTIESEVKRVAVYLRGLGGSGLEHLESDAISQLGDIELIKEYIKAWDRAMAMPSETSEGIKEITQREIDEFRKLLEEFEDLPSARQSLSGHLRALKEFRDHGKDVAEGYLTGLHESIAASKLLQSELHKAQSELNKLNRTVPEAGTTGAHEQSIQAARERVKELEEDIAVRNEQIAAFRRYFPIFAEYLGYLELSEKRLTKMHVANKQVIDDFNKLDMLMRRDALQNIVKDMLGWSKEIPKVSQVLEKIRSIGKDNLDLRRTDLYDWPSRETVERNIVKAMKQFQNQEKEIARFYRGDLRGREAFREELIKQLQASGEDVSLAEKIMAEVERKRMEGFREANDELERQLEWFLDNRHIMIKNAIRAEARQHIEEFARSLVMNPLDWGFEQLWQRHVEDPKQHARAIEDIQESTAEKIFEIQHSTRAGVRAGHADQVLSARQRRKKIIEIKRDEAKQIREIEEENAKRMERAWEDTLDGIKKYFVEFAKEQLMIRFARPWLNKGVEQLSKGLNWLGLDKLLPISDRPTGADEPSYWNQQKQYLEEYMRKFVDQLKLTELQAEDLADSHKVATDAGFDLAEAALAAAKALREIGLSPDPNAETEIKKVGEGQSVRLTWDQRAADIALDFLENTLNTVPSAISAGSKIVNWIGESMDDEDLPEGSVEVGDPEWVSPDELKDIYKTSQDHPYNDRRMRMLGWSRATAYSKRLGFNTAGHMRDYFQDGFEDRLKRFESKPDKSGSGSSSGNLVDELREIKDAVVELQEITSGVGDRPVDVKIGDKETRKISHNDNRMTRQRRVIKRR